MKESTIKPSFGVAMKWAFALQFVQQGFTALTSIFLASFLGPRDFGIAAMALVFISFLHLLAEQGLSATIIQRQDLSGDHLNAIFWINLCFSTVLVIICILLAPWWASINRVVELEQCLYLLSPVILVQALTIIQVAICQRKKQFKPLALRSGIASTIGGITGLVLAVFGLGWKAIVYQQLVSSIIGALLLWSLSNWRPGANFSRKDIKELLHFSSGVFLGKIALIASNKSDSLILGLYFGPVAVGLYRFAQRLVELVFDSLTRPFQLVALPHFSECQNDPIKLKQAFKTCIRGSTAITVPLLSLTAFFSGSITTFIGEHWHDARYSLTLLSTLAAFKSVTLFTNSLLLARGKLFKRAIMLWCTGLINPIAFASTAILLKDSTPTEQSTGIAITGLLTFFLAYLPINCWMCKKEANCSFLEIAIILKTPITATFAGIFTSSLFLTFTNSPNLEHVSIPISILAGLATMIATTAFVDPLLVKEFTNLLKRRQQLKHILKADEN